MDKSEGACSTCDRPVVKIDGLWIHADPADGKYCDEVMKPVRVMAILDYLQAKRIAKSA